MLSPAQRHQIRLKREARAALRKKRSDARAQARAERQSDLFNKRIARAIARIKKREDKRRSRRDRKHRNPNYITDVPIQGTIWPVAPTANGTGTWKVYTFPVWKRDRFYRTGGANTPKPHAQWTDYFGYKRSFKSALNRTENLRTWFNTGQQAYVTRSWVVNSVTSEQMVLKDTALLKEHEEKAFAKLYHKFQQQRNAEWDAMVSLGEARETVVTLLRTARRLTTAYSQLKKGDVTGFRDLVTATNATWFRLKSRTRKSGTQYWSTRQHSWVTPAEIWLENYYSWVPLLQDLDDAAQYYARKCIEQRLGYRKVSGWSGGERQSQVESWGIYTASEISSKVLTSVSYRQTVWARPRFYREITSLSQLDYTDIASVAWGLAPLSFVADWVINVGEVLGSLAEFKNWQVEKYQKSYSYTQNETVYASRVTGNGYSNTRVTTTKGYTNAYSEWNRAQHVFPNALPLHSKLTNPWKTPRVLSALSLLAVAFGGRLPPNLKTPV